MRDGHAVTASSRNSFYHQQFLEMLEQANPVGDIHVITDNLSGHNSKSTREWLIDHPRITHAFIPVGACWLDLQEPWWRLFRREALAGQSFADPNEIDQTPEICPGKFAPRICPSGPGLVAISRAGRRWW